MAFPFVVNRFERYCQFSDAVYGQDFLCSGLLSFRLMVEKEISGETWSPEKFNKDFGILPNSPFAFLLFFHPFANLVLNGSAS